VTAMSIRAAARHESVRPCTRLATRRGWRSPALALLVLLAGSTTARDARAWGESRLRGVYAPAGLVLGASQHPQQKNGLILGGEQSLVFYAGTKRDTWIGLYADFLRDLGPGRTRLGLGPELGWGILGFDGGFVAEFGGRRTFTGIEARVLVTFSVLAVFGRTGHLFGGAPEPAFFETGLLLKFPFALSTNERP
jgi:hypothetical protein